MSEDKWGWMFEGHENAHGPFDTREDAITDAREQIGPDDPSEVMVGKILFAKAEDYSLDLDDFIEHIEERAYDNFSFLEDAVFDVLDGAKEAYNTVMEAFLNAYVSSSYWCLGARGTETIQIERTDDAV